MEQRATTPLGRSFTFDSPDSVASLWQFSSLPAAATSLCSYAYSSGDSRSLVLFPVYILHSDSSNHLLNRPALDFEAKRHDAFHSCSFSTGPWGGLHPPPCPFAFHPRRTGAASGCHVHPLHQSSDWHALVQGQVLCSIEVSKQARAEPRQQPSMLCVTPKRVLPTLS